MIRLDGNSLAAFRGAGVAGTVQSVAGCELFGAARSPLWASPYSAAATRALKAQFPTQWATIRDYGFSHPEIVGYMNAYAPEDAKIAYSLVEGIGTRWLYNNGAACIDTGIILTSFPYNLKTKVRYKSLGGERDYCGNDGGSRRYPIEMGVQSGTSFGLWNNGPYGQWWTPTTIETDMVLELEAGYEENNRYLSLSKNGGAKSDYSRVGGNNISGGANVALYAGGTNGYCVSNLDAAYYVLSANNGADKRHFIPFKLGVARSADQVYPSSKGAQAVGTLGMLDLITGKFHPNAASSGAFSESITSPS